MAFSSTRARGKSGGSQQVAEWLHDIFIEDIGLKLIALVIAVGFWLAVTGLRAPATVRLRSVPLEFILPENVEIGNEPIEEVDVTLEGSQGRLADVNARNLVGRADVTQLRPGERVARLNPQSVVFELPSGVRVIAIEPRSVALRLEPVIEREVEVEARFDGEPAPGFVRSSLQITPARVRLRGPESRVIAVGKVQTETISLNGQSETFLTQTAVDIADRKVVPIDGVVSVRVEISEERAERRFGEVPVAGENGAAASPSSAAVTLRGPKSVINTLRPEDIRLVVQETPGEPVRARLVLPPNLDGRIELVSTSPPGFRLVN